MNTNWPQTAPLSTPPLFSGSIPFHCDTYKSFYILPIFVCVWIHCVAASACICVIKCAATFYVTWCAPPEKCKCMLGPYHNNWRGRLWFGDWRSFQLLTAIMCNFVFLCSRELIQTNKSIYEANCPSEQCMSLEITVKHVTTSQHKHTQVHTHAGKQGSAHWVREQ